MTPIRYRQLIKRLGMTQVGAGRFLQVADRQSRRFATGVRGIPGAIALLLELMAKEGYKPNDVRKIAGLPAIEGLNNPVGRPAEEED
jgi:hypothetical protein